MIIVILGRSLCLVYRLLDHASAGHPVIVVMPEQPADQPLLVVVAVKIPPISKSLEVMDPKTPKSLYNFVQLTFSCLWSTYILFVIK